MFSNIFLEIFTMAISRAVSKLLFYDTRLAPGDMV